MSKETDFYALSWKTPGGEEMSMKEFKGKLILIVNTATKCVFTPQFAGLEKLHKEYGDKGLVVLGFPSNDFMDQEPETNETMVKVCQVNHGVTFQLTEKVHVTGKNTHPVFAYLQKNTPNIIGKRIKWNFTKFLVSPEGEPLKRYEPIVKPAAIEKDVKKYLA